MPLTPGPALPSNATPFRVLFGRNVRKQIDTMTPLDGSEFRGELDTFATNQHQALVEVKAVQEKRRADKVRA